MADDAPDDTPLPAHPGPDDTPPATLPAFAPVPRAKDRSNGWKPEVQRAFLEALAETGSVRFACKRVGRADHGAYALRRHPEAAEFRAAWDAALDIGMRRLEDALADRAIHGVEVPVFCFGNLIGYRTQYNDRLGMFMLRNRLPARYAAGGGPKALNAIGRMDHARLKKQWRKEWEAEREANTPSPAEIRRSIERKVAAFKARVVARTSPRAFEHELAASAQTRADEAAGWRPGRPYGPYADKAAELLPQFIEEVRREYPQHAGWRGDGEDEDDDAAPAPARKPGAPEAPAAPDHATPLLPSPEVPPGGPRIRSLKGEWE